MCCSSMIIATLVVEIILKAQVTRVNKRIVIVIVFTIETIARK